MNFAIEVNLIDNQINMTRCLINLDRIVYDYGISSIIYYVAELAMFDAPSRAPKSKILL